MDNDNAIMNELESVVSKEISEFNIKVEKLLKENRENVDLEKQYETAKNFLYAKTKFVLFGVNKSNYQSNDRYKKSFEKVDKAIQDANKKFSEYKNGAAEHSPVSMSGNMEWFYQLYELCKLYILSLNTFFEKNQINQTNKEELVQIIKVLIESINLLYDELFKFKSAEEGNGNTEFYPKVLKYTQDITFEQKGDASDLGAKKAIIDNINSQTKNNKAKLLNLFKSKSSSLTEYNELKINFGNATDEDLNLVLTELNKNPLNNPKSSTNTSKTPPITSTPLPITSTPLPITSKSSTNTSKTPTNTSKTPTNTSASNTNESKAKKEKRNEILYQTHNSDTDELNQLLEILNKPCDKTKLLIVLEFLLSTGKKKEIYQLLIDYVNL
jgi:hypothetical protein